ncbi:MAG: PAS domain S-box protein, partial [Tannerellaceae bacterium]
MGIILAEFEQYFNYNPIEDFSPHEYQKIISDLYRSSSVCSAAFNKAALITCTQKSRLYYISDSYAELTGYSKEEVLSVGDQFVKSIMHPDDLKDLAIL